MVDFLLFPINRQFKALKIKIHKWPQKFFFCNPEGLIYYSKVHL
jgi:hypothetical protein